MSLKVVGLKNTKGNRKNEYLQNQHNFREWNKGKF